MKKKVFFIMVAIMMVAISGVFGQKKFKSIILGPVVSVAPKSFGLIPTPIESMGCMIGVNNVFFDKVSVWASYSPDFKIRKFPTTEELRIGSDYDLGKQGNKLDCRIGAVLGYSQYSGFTMMTGEKDFRSLKDQSLKIGPSVCFSYDLDRSVCERYKIFGRLDAHFEFLNPPIKESGWFSATVGVEFMPFRW